MNEGSICPCCGVKIMVCPICGTKLDENTDGAWLKEKIKSMNVSQNDFVDVFNAWLKDKQKNGKYVKEPILRKEHVSRWKSTVKMRKKKKEMFEDFFGGFENEENDR